MASHAHAMLQVYWDHHKVPLYLFKKTVMHMFCLSVCVELGSFSVISIYCDIVSLDGKLDSSSIRSGTFQAFCRT